MTEAEYILVTIHGTGGGEYPVSIVGEVISHDTVDENRTEFEALDPVSGRRFQVALTWLDNE